MKERKSTLITLLVLVGTLLLVGFIVYYIQQRAVLSERDTESSQTLVASEETPYTDLSGDTFTFDEFRGKVRVVNTWASWCPFCVAELKDFEVLAAEYAQKEVAVIAVNRKETKEKAQAFLNTVGSFEHVHFAIDLTDAFYKSVGGFSMPETVFYDAKGNIFLHKRGFMDLEEMRLHTEAALAASDN